MDDVGGPASRLAISALALLNDGNISGARALLESVAKGVQGSDTLRSVALACTLGAHPTTYLIFNLDFGELADPSTRWLDHSHSPLSSSRMSSIRAGWRDRPDELLAANTLLKSCSLSREPWPMVGGDGSTAPIGEVRASAPGSLDGSAKREWFDVILSSYAARASISDRVGKRLLVWASEAGMSQREIAKKIRKPQTYVHRQLRAVEEDPSTAVLSPRELYEHFSAGEFDRAQLLGLLAAYPYESGVRPEGAEEWGYVAGSLDQLTQLAIEGSISRDELDLVLAGHELVRESSA